MQLASELLRDNINFAIDAKKRLLNNAKQLEVFDNVVTLIVNKYRCGGRLYIAGNGGSAADAQHLAAEFVSKLAKDRAPLPAEALTVDTSVLTAIGNDYGFDQIFSRQLKAKVAEHDIFLGITTSGNSINIIRALEACRVKNIPTIILTGHNGGSARDLADYCLIVPGESTATIQESHILLAHTICQYVEAVIFG
jgi:D-sedoheptulose 7-phosphate isomerase